MNMQVSLTTSALESYVASQISNFFPDSILSRSEVKPYIHSALERAEYCFGHIKNKYHPEGGEIFFNHLHTDQYAIFLYYLSNSIYRAQGDINLASKIYALNKSLNAVDLLYEVELPDIFYISHCVGTVLGRGKYSDYLFVHQGCTVGGNIDGVYPTLGEGVVMYGGSAIIGDCNIGDNTWLSYNTVIMDRDIPPSSVVFNREVGNRIRTTGRNVLKDQFQIPGSLSQRSDVQ
jgi:serine O-acetyltransferase